MQTTDCVERLLDLTPTVVHHDTAVGLVRHCKCDVRRSAAIHEADTLRRELRFQHGEQIEVDDIEDLHRAICARRRVSPAIRADGNALDLTVVRLELLDELDTARDLLPELHKSIYGASYEEVGVRCKGAKGELLFVHERLGVSRGGWQGSDVLLLVWQLSPLLFLMQDNPPLLQKDNLFFIIIIKIFIIYPIIHNYI